MIIIKTAVILMGIVIWTEMFRNIRLKHIVLCVLSGVLSLIAADGAMSFYGGNLPVNIYTLCFSATGGIPAVILTLLLITFI